MFIVMYNSDQERGDDRSGGKREKIISCTCNVAFEVTMQKLLKM